MQGPWLDTLSHGSHEGPQSHNVAAESPPAGPDLGKAEASVNVSSTPSWGPAGLRAHSSAPAVGAGIVLVTIASPWKGSLGDHSQAEGGGGGCGQKQQEGRETHRRGGGWPRWSGNTLRAGAHSASPAAAPGRERGCTQPEAAPQPPRSWELCRGLNSQPDFLGPGLFFWGEVGGCGGRCLHLKRSGLSFISFLILRSYLHEN